MLQQTAESSVDLEEGILGALLLDNDVWQECEFLQPHHFSEPLYQLIIARFHAAAAEGRALDAIVLVSEMEGQDIQPTVQVLLDRAAPTKLIPTYCKTLLDMYARRAIIDLTEEVRHVALHPSPEVRPAAYLDEVAGRLEEIRVEAVPRGTARHMGAAIQDALDQAAAAYRNEASPGWDWCLPQIQDVVDARLEPGHLVGLLGASGDGKTSLVLQQMRALIDEGVPCLFLSGEQTPTQNVWQMYAQHAGVSAAAIRSGKITERDFDAYYEWSRELAKKPFLITQWHNQPAHSLGVKIQSFVREHGEGVVFIDHAKKIVPARPRDIFAQQVFQVFSDVKDHATRNGCAIVLLMQRNSDFLGREVMMPVRKDAYGGEGTLQNLDTCVALYRPDIWHRERAEVSTGETRADHKAQSLVWEGKAIFRGLKSRFGQNGQSRQVLFEAPYTRFASAREAETLI